MPLEIEPLSVWNGEPADLLDRVKRYWYPNPASFDRKAHRLATEEEISAFEETNSVKFPWDFREYFLRLNGVDEDDQLFCFWPLSSLARLENARFKWPAGTLNFPGSDSYFVFADFLIECMYHAIYLGDDPSLQNRVILPDFPNQPVIAPNFSNFLEIYLADAPAIYGNF